MTRVANLTDFTVLGYVLRNIWMTVKREVSNIPQENAPV
jgi:hypothetical protein